MSASFISAAKATGSAGTTLDCTSTITVAVGDVIHVGYSYDVSGGTSESVSDNLGNSYTVLDAITDTDDSQRTGHAWGKITVGGASTVRLNTPNNNGARSLSAAGYTGVDNTAADGNNAQWETAPTTGTDATNSNTAANSGTGILVGFSTHIQGTNIPAAGTGFTSRDSDNQPARVWWRREDKAVASGTFEATFTAGADSDHITCMVMFKEPGGGGVNNAIAWIRA